MGFQLSQVAQPDWTSAVAAVIDSRGIVRGTAFFVGPDVALTCYHVLSVVGEERVTLKSIGSSDLEKEIGRDFDEVLDLALVRVGSRAERPWLTLSTGSVERGREIHSHGFPRDHVLATYPDGYPMDPAKVSGKTTLRWGGRPVQLLVLADADATKGMSGAPAIDAQSNTVVGVLRYLETGKVRVLAVPAEAAMRRWPRLPVDHERPDSPSSS